MFVQLPVPVSSQVPEEQGERSMKKIALIALLLIGSMSLAATDTFILIDGNQYHGIVQEWDDESGRVYFFEQNDQRSYFIRYRNLTAVELQSGERYTFPDGQRISEKKQAILNEPRANLYLTNETIIPARIINWDDKNGRMVYWDDRDELMYTIDMLGIKQATLETGVSYIFNVANRVRERIPNWKLLFIGHDRTTRTPQTTPDNKQDVFHLTEGVTVSGDLLEWADAEKVLLFYETNDSLTLYIPYRELERVDLRNGKSYTIEGSVRTEYKPEPPPEPEPETPPEPKTSGTEQASSDWQDQQLDLFVLTDDSEYWGRLTFWDDTKKEATFFSPAQGKTYFARYVNLKRVRLSSGEVFEFINSQRLPVDTKQVQKPQPPRPQIPDQTQPTSSVVTDTQQTESGALDVFVMQSGKQFRGSIQKWDDVNCEVFYEDAMGGQLYKLPYQYLERVILSSGAIYAFQVGPAQCRRYQPEQGTATVRTASKPPPAKIPAPDFQMQEPARMIMVNGTSERVTILAWDDTNRRVVYQEISTGKLFYIRYSYVSAIQFDDGRRYEFRQGKRIPKQFEEGPLARQ